MGTSTGAAGRLGVTKAEESQVFSSSRRILRKGTGRHLKNLCESRRQLSFKREKGGKRYRGIGVRRGYSSWKNGLGSKCLKKISGKAGANGRGE